MAMDNARLRGACQRGLIENFVDTPVASSTVQPSD